MTWRSIIISFILLVAVSLAITYNDLGYGNTPLTGAIQLPLIVAFLLVIFSAGINPLLRMLSPRHTFSQAELMVIWCILAAGLTVPSFGILRYMLPMMVAPFYYAGQDSLWAQTFYRYIPEWLVPTINPRSPVVSMFFESARGKPIPLAPWVIPFFGWGVMLIGIFLVMFCMTAIIRKQWVENERLSFPLARIPLEISQPADRGHLFNRLFGSPLTWIGAAVPVCFWGMMLLSKFYPWFPYIHNNNAELFQLFNQMKGWQGLCKIYFLTIGVTFLLPTDISLSLWLFFILGQVQRIIRLQMGYIDTQFDLQQQAGGYFAFAAVALWTMRHHLRDVFRKAVFNAPDVDDSGEGLSYRFSLIGIVIGGAIVVGWMCFIGSGLLPAIMTVAVSCIGFMVLGRFVAQCGLIHVSFTPGPMPLTQAFLGSGNISGEGLTAMTYYQAALFGDQREVLSMPLLNNTKIAERRIDLRKLFAATAVALAVTYSISYFSQVHGYYEFGAYHPQSYHARYYPQGRLNDLATAVKSDEGFLALGATGIKHMAIGGGSFLLIHVLRSRFYWWPIHPIGLLTIRTWPLQVLWISIMIGWLAKTLAVRYARGPTMAKVRCFFLGLIIGDVCIAMIGGIMGLIAQRPLIWVTS